MEDVRIYKDDVAEALDELASIAKIWENKRAEGKPCRIIRRAYLEVAKEVLSLAEGKMDAVG